LQLDDIYGMAQGRKLRLGNALGVFVAVLDVQVLPNAATLVLTINDFKGQFEASAIA
jgi:hypothetical protein